MHRFADAVGRRKRITGVALALAGLLSACGGSDKASPSTATSSGPSPDQVLGAKQVASGTPVKIGLFNAEGGSAVAFPEIGDAAVAAFNYANDYQGGLAGHRIEVVRCADKNDGASASACANQFVSEKVVGVVAGLPLNPDLVVPTVLAQGIPYVGDVPASPTELTSSETFFLSTGGIGSFKVWAQYAKQHGYQHVGIFTLDVPSAIGALQAIAKPAFDAAGIQFDVTPIPAGTSDATSQIESGLAKHPDVVALAADSTLCQSILTALQTAGNTLPVMGAGPCESQSVIQAVGADGLNGMINFELGDGVSNDKEAVLYRAIMAKYAPDIDPGGFTNVGYLSALGFVRAANAGGLTGDPTPAAVKAAIGNAKNVPLPVGRGETFSCDHSSWGADPLIKATICNTKLFQTTLDGTKERTDFTTFDASK
jgi:branched-chain amino acid transport system substrate-binding protein